MSLEPSHLGEQRLLAAQELHDVLSSGITAIYVHAASALQLMADRPEQAAVALTTIKAISKNITTEMRVVLDLLYRPEAQMRPPAAGLHQVGDLIRDMSHSGLTIELEVSGERPVPAAVDLAAYRIVQESLTNVLRHAGPAETVVRIIYAPDAVGLEITNSVANSVANGVRPGRHEGADELSSGGRGISGMRRRAQALGGSLLAGPVDSGGFRVQARLPTADPALPPAGNSARRCLTSSGRAAVSPPGDACPEDRRRQ